MSKHTPTSRHTLDWFRSLSRCDFENGAILDEIEDVYRQRDDLLAACKALVKCNEEWNAAVENTIGKPPGWNDSYLDDTRAAIAKTSP